MIQLLPLMLPAVFLLIVIGVTGVLLAVGVLYAIGKYNLLAGFRHRISTEMLQLDFSLRRQAMELLTLKSCIPELEIGSSFLARAEEQSHKAVSGPLCQRGLTELGIVTQSISSCWESVLSLSGSQDPDHEKTLQRARSYLDANTKIWCRIISLVDDYSNHLHGFLCRLMAAFLHYEILSVGADSLSRRAAKSAKQTGA